MTDFTSPKTWSVDEVLTSSDMNTYVRDNMNYMHEREALSDNALINGDMLVWQRGTSFTSVAHGDYLADGWLHTKSGAMVLDVTRSTDVPTFAQAGHEFQYSTKIDIATADASIAGGDYATLQQRIEGYRWLPYMFKEFTISFWLKSTKTGTLSVAFQNNGQDQAYIDTITISDTNWNNYSITVPASDATTGTWHRTTGVGLRVYFMLAAGANFHASTQTWITTNDLAASGQTNFCDSTSNDLYITGIKINKGNVAIGGFARSYVEELLLAQRYYWQLSEPAPYPPIIYGPFVATGSTTVVGTVPINVPMRIDPTITDTNLFFNDLNSAAYRGITAITSLAPNDGRFLNLSITTVAGNTAGDTGTIVGPNPVGTGTIEFDASL